jgi:3-oxoadipate enol-lactonase
MRQVLVIGFGLTPNHKRLPLPSRDLDGSANLSRKGGSLPEGRRTHGITGAHRGGAPVVRLRGGVGFTGSLHRRPIVAWASADGSGLAPHAHPGAQCEAMKVNANGIEIHCVVEGNGPWLTLSNSLTCDLSMWDAQATLLSPHFKVLRYDTRGHGATSATTGAYTFDQLADDAKGLLDALGIERTHWVGLSLGGMIGQVCALKYPGLFQSIALCDTASRYPPEAALVWAERRRIAQEKGMDALVDGTLARWFTQPYRTSHPEVMARFAQMIRSTSVAGYVGCGHAIPDIDVTDRLKEIECPALVIVGEQDMGTPVAMARDIHDALPDSRLVVIPSAGHLPNIEQPQAFNDALLGFLEHGRRTPPDA